MASDRAPRKVELVFFRNDAGGEPVRDWLREMGEVDRHAIGTDLLRAQWRWPVGMPLCRPMGERSVGGANPSFQQPHCPRVDLFLPRPSGGFARIHQESTSHAQGRSNTGAQAPEGAGTVSKKNMGSSIDDFLRKENIFEEAQAQAVKEVVAWQLAKAMKKKKISKARMAVLLKTSRSQVDRILDPKRDITLSSLQRAAALVGQRVVIELV